MDFFKRFVFAAWYHRSKWGLAVVIDHAAYETTLTLTIGPFSAGVTYDSFSDLA